MEEVILSKNFFNKDEIKILESYDNGKEYVLVYIKLLALSGTDKQLRFKKGINYGSYVILSALTNTSTDFIKETLEVLEKLGMIKKVLGIIIFNELL